MAVSRNNRDYKKQMGQYMTPFNLSKKLISHREYGVNSLILEPSFGTGSFLIAIINRFIEIHQPSNISKFVSKLLKENIYGVEMDSDLYNSTIKLISEKYDVKLSQDNHNLYNSDFFDVPFFNINFDYIEGNPPFGGSFDEQYGIKLDKLYGKYQNIKIKKETYSFFTHRCFKLLKNNGELGFVCSDTFMTIPTMKGIRKILLDHTTTIVRLNFFSDETHYPMVYFNLKKSPETKILIDGIELSSELIKLTDTLSFTINSAYKKYFDRVPLLSNYLICSSGMTIGKNELFLKDVKSGKLIETFDYKFKNEVKTLDKEKSRARLGKVTKSNLESVMRGDTERLLKIDELNSPIYIDIPNGNYLPYNKATADRFYSEPKTYIYWKNNGEAVLNFKKTGPWYLHGVGGSTFFKKQGLTWRLISNDIRCRFLPKGYILDSGSPVGVLRENIDLDELYFIIGWLNTDLATNILKNVINHTRNIQSKDIERLPYPIWVDGDVKTEVIHLVKNAIKLYNSSNTETLISKLNKMFG